MRWRILSVVGTLYAVQFIPAVFIFMTLPIIMREAGHSATTIGLVQLVGLPYIFKFLWAPLIDKFKPGRQRYKSWIVILSSIHVAALLTLAFVEPAGPILPLVILLLIAITAVSTQDVAVDALAISLMHPGERALGASFQAFGVYLGAVVGAFGFLHLYQLIGWTSAVLIQTALFALPLLLLLRVDEPERPADAPAVGFSRALKFFAQPRMGRWLALLACIRLPLVFISLPIRLMMVDEGMSTDEIALWFGLIAMSGAGTAALSFGPLTRKLPRLMALYLVAVINLAVLIMVYGLASNLPDSIRYAIVITWIAIATTDTVLLRGAMDKVRPESPGFDFSIQVALFTLLALLANPLSGAIIDAQGYLPVFIVAILLALIPLLILRIGFPLPHNKASSVDGEAVISTATLATRNASKVLDSCESHFSDHGINCNRPDADVVLMEAMGCQVKMQQLDNAVDIRIQTPSDNFMIFIRDELVEHIGQIDPEAVAQLSWSGGIQIGELPANFRILRAVRRQPLFPGLVRVTLAGIDVKALTSDGIHIKVMMPATHGRQPVWPVIGDNGSIYWPKGDDKLHTRFVTIRNIRPDANEIDVDIAAHDTGLISSWATLAGNQQEVGVMGPGGDTQLPVTDKIILAADLTGLPALARFIEDAKGQVSGFLFAAAPSQQDLENYLPTSNLNVTAIDPDSFAEQVVDRIRQHADPPPSYAWFAGEFSTARALRKLFRDQFELPKSHRHSTAYWRKGKPGHAP